MNPIDIEDSDERYEAMVARYGKSGLILDRVRVGEVLRKFALRDELHPRNAVVTVADSEESAEAYAEANRRYYGHRVNGPYLRDGKWVTVIDTRRFAARTLAGVTEPSLPDDYQPERGAA